MSLQLGPTKVLLISVNYNAPEATLSFLDSLDRTGKLSQVRVIIVDSASRSESLATLQASMVGRVNCELLELGENLGYFGGARCGLDHFIKVRGALPDWVIVCNNDVLIEDHDFFSRLFSHDPLAMGMIAPRIRTSQGTDQNPFMRHRPGFCRRASMRFYSYHYRLAVFWDWLSREKQSLLSLLKVARNGGTDGSRTSSEEIYAPHGSFLIFSRKYFESGGYLDSKLFLYGEEIASAEICRSLNLTVLYVPALEVIHHEHASTEGRMSRRSYEHHRSTVAYLMSKYLSK
jgi:GT2 family glycosyltransferase